MGKPACLPAEPATTPPSMFDTILVSFELSQSSWVITVLRPETGTMSRHNVVAGNTTDTLNLLNRQRARVSPTPVRIVAIHEAGRDGFWVHRWLLANGVESHVVDASSIAGPRRRRRAKSDGVDGETLIRTLAAWRRREPRVCSMVAPPSVEIEDRRRLGREREQLVRERIVLTNRIGGLLATLGIHDYQPLKRDRHAALAALCTRDGAALPPHLGGEIKRMLIRLDLLMDQIKAVEAERDALLTADAAVPTDATAQLDRLRGLGPESIAILRAECFSRHFANRRQLAAFAGLAPTPWCSGSIQREQGIGGGGNARVRKVMIQIAWMWLRHQPGSALSRWFHAKTAGTGPRQRRIGVVALARRLLIALWRYVTDGTLPEAAILKPRVA